MTNVEGEGPLNTGEQDAPNETPQAEQTPPAGEAPPASAKPAEQETPSRLERAEQEAPSRPERPEQPGGAPPERRRRRFGRRKVCTFCVDKVQIIDYKDPMKLRRYLSDRGRIEPRRKTGTCAKHQRWLSIALKRARHLALLPYTPEHIRVTGVSTSR